MATVGECSVAAFDADVNWLANVLQTYVANERSSEPELGCTEGFKVFESLVGAMAEQP